MTENKYETITQHNITPTIGPKRVDHLAGKWGKALHRAFFVCTFPIAPSAHLDISYRHTPEEFVHLCYRFVQLRRFKLLPALAPMSRRLCPSARGKRLILYKLGRMASPSMSRSTEFSGGTTMILY